jgi:monoamine oxidase
LKEAIEHVKPDALHDPVIQYFISHNVEFDYGGSIESLSAAYYDDDGQLEGIDAIPIGGFEPIIQELAKGLNIQKSIEVQSIRYTTEGARLETNTGVVYKADKVVCTLPLGVLKSGDVDFHPLLSQRKRDAIERIGWGTVNKVCLVFDNVYWPEEKGFGMATTLQKYPYFVNKHIFTGSAVLEGYAIGRHAAAMEDQDEETIIEDVLHEIQKFVDSDSCDKETLKRALRRFYISRWGKEKFTRGAYSYKSPETRSYDFDAFTEPQQHVLFFAGEHTSCQYRGTVHGAYLSGNRVGKQVAGSIRCK